MHDSELIGIKPEENGAGFVLLDAYVHRTIGTPGRSPGEGGIQRIRMNFLSMQVEGEIGLPTYLYEGSLLIEKICKTTWSPTLRRMTQM